MRRTKEEAENTRQSLLDAALTVFSQKGYEATRLEDVADAAGVTRGAVYHHFGGKAELYMMLIRQGSEQSSQVIGRAISEGGDFLTITRRVLVYTLRLLGEDARFREIYALLLFKTGAAPELHELNRQRREQARGMVESVGQFFQMGIQQGQLREGLDALTAARAFLAYQDGLTMLWLSNPQAFSITEDAEALTEVLIQGIASR